MLWGSTQVDNGRLMKQNVTYTWTYGSQGGMAKRSLEEQQASDLTSGLLALSFLKNVSESSQHPKPQTQREPSNFLCCEEMAAHEGTGAEQGGSGCFNQVWL